MNGLARIEGKTSKIWQRSCISHQLPPLIDRFQRPASILWNVNLRDFNQKRPIRRMYVVLGRQNYGLDDWQDAVVNIVGVDFPRNTFFADLVSSRSNMFVNNGY
jgi:hypothetical protein